MQRCVKNETIIKVEDFYHILIFPHFHYIYYYILCVQHTRYFSALVQETNKSEVEVLFLACSFSNHKISSKFFLLYFILQKIVYVCIYVKM